MKRSNLEKIDLFVGDNEQFDDITMLCLKYKKGDKKFYDKGNTAW